MDIRVRPGNSGITSCRTTSGMAAPCIWLVTAGSFEQRAANYIACHQNPDQWNTVLPSNEQAYRDLLKEHNRWPSKDKSHTIADHALDTVFDWLMQDPASSATPYKYTNPKQADHTPIPSPNRESTSAPVTSQPSPSTSVPSPVSHAAITVPPQLPTDTDTLTSVELGSAVSSGTDTPFRDASVQTDPLTDPVIILDDLPITESPRPPPGVSERLQKQIRKVVILSTVWRRVRDMTYLNIRFSFTSA